MEDSVKLSIEIKNTEPLELIDVTRSLMSLADEYKRFLAKSTTEIDPDSVKLYITNLNSGSLLAELIPFAPYMLPIVQYSTTIIDYAKYLKVLYDYFTGKTKELLEHPDKTSLQNVSDIVEPIAKDKGSQFNLGAINASGNVAITVNLNSLEANAVQNAARREIERIREPDRGIHNKVLMYLYQARDDLTSTTGDKAVIESISPNPVKTVFMSETIKAKVLLDPFKKVFIVDVAVETINNVPKLYRILELHESFDRE